MATRITRPRAVKNRGILSSSSDDDDVMMEDDDVATTQGVKADAQGFAVRAPCDIDTAGSVTGSSLILPRPLGADDGERLSMEDDDDISTLTEYSMEEEDDNVSQTTQNTAWTVTTTGTDSTTVPTRNFPSPPDSNNREQLGEKRATRKENKLLNNSQFKRRRFA